MYTPEYLEYECLECHKRVWVRNEGERTPIPVCRHGGLGRHNAEYVQMYLTYNSQVRSIREGWRLKK
jgi:hypothetical protein